MQAQLNWTGEMQFVARAEQGPAVVLDTPEGGSGCSPMQMMLVAIAGCAAMDVVAILKKRRAPMTGLQVTVQGERAGDHPKRFTRVVLDFVVTGNGIKEKDVGRAIDFSMTKYCSAVASINAQVSHTFRIQED